jgi:hypothetical protein
MIMITALISDALADPQARDLFEQILEKPVDMDELHGLVSEALEGGRQAIGDHGGSNGDAGGGVKRPEVLVQKQLGGYVTAECPQITIQNGKLFLNKCEGKGAANLAP